VKLRRGLPQWVRKLRWSPGSRGDPTPFRSGGIAARHTHDIASADQRLPSLLANRIATCARCASVSGGLTGRLTSDQRAEVRAAVAAWPASSCLGRQEAGEWMRLLDDVDCHIDRMTRRPSTASRDCWQHSAPATDNSSAARAFFQDTPPGFGPGKSRRLTLPNHLVGTPGIPVHDAVGACAVANVEVNAPRNRVA
jgi:hypothetical protein